MIGKEATPQDIPDGMVTRCPMVNHMVKVATKCLPCEHCQSVGILNNSERVPWQDRHVIVCGFRRKLQIEFVEE